MAKSEERLQVGSHLFDAASGEVTDPVGRVASLRPQTAKVLQLLAEHRGELVSKDLLIETVWPGTFVTDDSLVQCVSEIRRALGTDAAEVKTIPKRGYRLEAAGERPVLPQARSRRRQALLPLLGMVCLVALALLWALRPGPSGDPVSLAILPFQNMSGDPDQAYLSNGVAEDLIVSMSQIADIAVVSRGTAFSVAGEGSDPRDVARALKVDYVLEGSVRRAGDTLRVSVSLVEGTNGANIWAERYEGSAEDMFRFQDEVLSELARVLSVRLSRAERARLGIRGTRDVDAHDAYLRGRELENLYTRETNIAAEAALTEALRNDPDFALAEAHLAQVYSFRVENQWSENPRDDIALAFRHAKRAVDLDPDLPFAQFSLGRLYTRSFAPDRDRAIAHYERAIALDPDYLDAVMFLANVHIFYGEAERALPLIDDAIARHPIPPYWYYLARGMAAFFLGDYPGAETALLIARDQNPTAPFPYRFLMATYGQMGAVDEADWTAMEYEALGRTATVEALLRTASIQDAGYRATFTEGFRKAGLPEN